MFFFAESYRENLSLGIFGVFFAGVLSSRFCVSFAQLLLQFSSLRPITFKWSYHKTLLQHKAEVLVVRGKKYTATLSMVDMQSGANSYYKLQLLQSKSGKKWVLRLILISPPKNVKHATSKEKEISLP